jgi:hypothetical protein
MIPVRTTQSKSFARSSPRESQLSRKASCGTHQVTLSPQIPSILGRIDEQAGLGNTTATNDDCPSRSEPDMWSAKHHAAIQRMNRELLNRVDTKSGSIYNNLAVTQGYQSGHYRAGQQNGAHPAVH